MGEIKFKVDDTFRQIVEHAIAAPARRATFGQREDSAIHLPSAASKSCWQLSDEDIDTSKVPVGLWLVKDTGCYLMSPGIPSLSAGDPAKPDKSKVLYAEGLGPDCDWDHQQDVCGGDDFVQFLPIDFIKDGLDAGYSMFQVDMEEESFGLSWYE